MEKNNLPNGWIDCTLEDIATVILGQSPPSSTYNNNENGLPFFQGKADFGDLHPIPRVWCSQPKKIAEPNEVLLSVRAPVGSTNLSNQQCCIGRGLSAIRPKIVDTPSKFFLYFFMNIKQDLDAKGTGTTFKAISGQQIRSLGIRLPPLKEQKRIVAKIEELFSLIDNSEKSFEFLIKKIDEYWKVILDLAFRGILTDSWRKTQKITKPNEHEIENWKKMRENQYQYGCKISRNKTKPKLSPFTICELNNIPDSWIGITSESACGHIIDCPHSTPKFLDHGKYCVDTTCIDNSKIRLEDLRFVSDNEFKDRTIRMPILTNDILFSREGTIGTTVLVPPKLELCLGQRIMLLRFAPFILPKFAELFLQSFEFQKQYKLLIKSTTSPHLNIEDIRKFFIIVPSLQEQELIVKILDENISLINSIKNTIQESLLQLKLLKKSLLHLGFEGKLVLQDPNDEPASELLKRIKN